MGEWGTPEEETKGHVEETAIVRLKVAGRRKIVRRHEEARKIASTWRRPQRRPREHEKLERDQEDGKWRLEESWESRRGHQESR